MGSASQWAWSIPLIVLTVILHVIGLGPFNVKMVQVLTVVKSRRHFIYAFALGIGVTRIWAILLHAIEAGIWATAYRLLGVLPDSKSAILYSLSAFTTYGQSEIILTERWRLMGGLEALNGIILIGLTTARIALCRRNAQAGFAGQHVDVIRSVLEHWGAPNPLVQTG